MKIATVSESGETEEGPPLGWKLRSQRRELCQSAQAVMKNYPWLGHSVLETGVQDQGDSMVSFWQELSFWLAVSHLLAVCSHGFSWVGTSAERKRLKLGSHLYDCASFVAQLVKNPPAMWETWVQSLGWEDPRGKGKAIHSSILAWKIPWMSPWGRKEWETTEQLYFMTAFNFCCCCSITKSCLTLQPDGWQQARFPCPSLSPAVCSNSCPSSQWCHPNISSSVIPFSSCLQFFPASGSFPMSQFFTSGGQSIGASASVLPINSQGWFPFGLTGFISLLSKGLSRVFSNTTVQKRQFFGAQPSLWSNSHIRTWLLEKP